MPQAIDQYAQAPTISIYISTCHTHNPSSPSSHCASHYSPPLSQSCASHLQFHAGPQMQSGACTPLFPTRLFMKQHGHTRDRNPCRDRAQQMSANRCPPVTSPTACSCRPATCIEGKRAGRVTGEEPWFTTPLISFRHHILQEYDLKRSCIKGVTL